MFEGYEMMCSDGLKEQIYRSFQLSLHFFSQNIYYTFISTSCLFGILK